MHSLEEVRAEYDRLDRLCGLDTSGIELKISKRAVKQLGSFRCPACGYHRHVTDVSVSKVVVSDAEHSEVEFSADGQTYSASISLPGGYNIYNACAAMA